MYHKLDSIASTYQPYAPLILRFSLAIVFFMFGAQKIGHVEEVTVDIELLLGVSFKTAAVLTPIIGAMELLIVGVFILGLKTRFFALVAAGFVAGIFVSYMVRFGFTTSTDLYRDIGLIGASIALFLMGAGPWSIDNRQEKAHTQKK